MKLLKRISKFFDNKKILRVWFLGLFILYVLNFLRPFFVNDFRMSFNYFDETSYWESLESFLHGEVIYRDYIWDYGILYVVLGIPFYLILGKSFFAVYFVRYVVFGALGIGLSYFVARKFFKGKWLLLLFSFLFLFNVNKWFTSLRSLLPEASLILIFYGFLNKRKKEYLFGSFLLSLAFLGSIEYFSASILVMLIFYCFSFNKYPFNLKILVFKIFIISFFPITYLIYLAKNEALVSFFYFYKQIGKSFWISPPCKAIYIRWVDFLALKNTSNIYDFWIQLNENLLTVNLYVFPLVTLILIFIVLKKVIKKDRIFILSFLTYYLLGYSRLILTPCVSRIEYNLFSFFFVFVFLFRLIKNKVFFSILTFWFFVSFNYSSSLKNIFEIKKAIKEVGKTSFFEKGKIRLPSDFIQDYEEIISFVENNTNKNDFVLDYPNSFYHLITERKTPISAPTICYYQLASHYEEKAYFELLKNPPKLIIINTYNGVFFQIGQNFKTKFHTIGENFYFQGTKSPIEDFIEKNYKVVLKNSKAWVLEKRQKEIESILVLVPISNLDNLNFLGNSKKDVLIKFKLGKNKSLNISSDKFKDVDIAKVRFKLNGSIKYFDKYFLGIGFGTNYGIVNPKSGYVMSGEWQDLWFELPKFTDENEEVNSLYFISTINRGILPFEKERELLIESLRFYKINPELKFEDTEMEDI